jgi:hypothetical protein
MVDYYDEYSDEEYEDLDIEFFVPDSPGRRCNCEDAPCCGCNQ